MGGDAKDPDSADKEDTDEESKDPDSADEEDTDEDAEDIDEDAKDPDSADKEDTDVRSQKAFSTLFGNTNNPIFALSIPTPFSFPSPFPNLFSQAVLSSNPSAAAGSRRAMTPNPSATVAVAPSTKRTRAASEGADVHSEESFHTSPSNTPSAAATSRRALTPNPSATVAVAPSTKRTRAASKVIDIAMPGSVGIGVGQRDGSLAGPAPKKRSVTYSKKH